MAMSKWVKSTPKSFWFCCSSRNLLWELLRENTRANSNLRLTSLVTKVVVPYLLTSTPSTATVWDWMQLSWYVMVEVVICLVSQIWRIKTQWIGRRPAVPYPRWWVLNVDMERTNPLFQRLLWDLTAECSKLTKQSVTSGPTSIATPAPDPFSSEVLAATPSISWSYLQTQKN